MRITRIRIENFRSIQKTEIEPSEFGIFVGKNNHGKTNLFEAIEWFYNGSGSLNDIARNKDTALDVSVELEYCGVQAGIETVVNERCKESFRKFADGRDSIRVVRRKLEAGKRAIWDEAKGEWSSKNFAGFDKSFNDCLPRLEYVATTTRLTDVSKYGKKTPIGLMLSGVLTAILEKSEKYREFRAKFDEVFGGQHSDVRAHLDELSGRVKINMERQFPDCTKVSFDIAEPAFEDLLRNFDTTIHDGIETRAEEKGDGMQRALMLAIIKTYSDYRREKDDLGKHFLFLLDEAELHLHPTAQRQLKEALLLIAESGDQVMINTHSSVLVADDHPKQKLFMVEKDGNITSITPVSHINKAQVVYDLLGGSPADLLFPSNFIVVEGRCEFELFKRIISRHYSEKPHIQVIYAEGDINKQHRSMDAINTAFTPLYRTPVYKERLVILCDRPNSAQEADFKNFRHAYTTLKEDDQMFVLDTCSLEQYYPQPWQKSASEVAAMTGTTKVELAIRVGDSITKVQFEQDMPKLFKALSKCWDKAYQ